MSRVLWGRLTSDRDWENGTIELHQGTVLYCEDEKLFKMWYTSGRPHGRHEKSICYAVSKDGVHWDLTKDKVFGHVNEMGERGPHSNDEAKVIYNPLTTEYECYHVPLVLPASEKDVVEYDSAPHIKRILARMVSEDGMNWSETKIIIEPDQDDPRGMQFYGMVAWPNVGLYLGPYYIGLLMAYDCVKQTIELELGYSAGGEQWFRVDRHRPFVPRGPKCSWDEGMVMSSWVP